VGVGNCASSFAQGLVHYRGAQANEPVPGLMHVDLGGYHVGDVEIASAFDVNAAKVGRDVAEAILAPPNNTHRFAPLPTTKVIVERGPTLDGLGKYLRDEVPESDKSPVDVAEVLADTRTDVLISYLPVGSQAATEYYAEAALKAAAPSSTACRCSSPPTRPGASASPRRGCRSSATTSRARWAPPSSTACWPT
jgi:myo-inositol-1-phosphate synthase